MKKIKTLCAVDNAIKRRLTRTTSEIANQVGFSRSAFYTNIEQISDHGGKVSYSRTSRCFYYEEEFDLKFEISSEAMTKVFGGKNVPSINSGRKEFTFENELEENLF